MDDSDKFLHQEIFLSDIENDETTQNITFEASKYIMKSYKCLVCKREFDHKSDILNHIEERHLEILISPSIKQENPDPYTFESNLEKSHDDSLDQVKQEFQEQQDIRNCIDFIDIGPFQFFNSNLDKIERDKKTIEEILFDYESKDPRDKLKFVIEENKKIVEKFKKLKREYEKLLQITRKAKSLPNFKQSVSSRTKTCAIKSLDFKYEEKHIIPKTEYSSEMKKQASEKAIRKRGQKQHKCSKCDYITLRADNMKRHNAVKHGEIELLKCSYCQKDYNRKDTLDLHVRTVHFGQKRFQCPNINCSHRTNNTSDMNKHIKVCKS